jgi:hypothetical protein
MSEWITVKTKGAKKHQTKETRDRDQRHPRKPRRSWRDHAKSIPGSGSGSESHESKTQHKVSLPSTEDIKEHNKLNDTWILWYHDTKSSDWSLSGYEQLFSFSTVEDFWILYNNLDDISSGMYYLMRKDIPPIWDAPENIGGGAWTFRVDKRNLSKFWEDLSLHCVGETICDASESIVGISISPKIRFATVRVWTSDTDDGIEKFNPVKESTQNGHVQIDFASARFTPNKQAST